MPVPQAPGANFLPSGTRLGKYELIRGVAVGGMAELYLARTVGHEAFERLVALKRILPQFAADDEFVRMFLDEARITAKLQHPNIAQVYDIGMDHDGLFFTMEFIPGENVQNILRTASMAKTRVPLAQGLAIAICAASGLHAAHEQRGNDGELLSIVHRDISPSNVIVSFDGCIKLIDFGVAKARGRRTKTRNGVIKGKISYMSPEQCRGEALDRRSDVFSLGILLYELTTTQRLFAGENEFAMIRQIVYQDAPRPSSRVADYPPELEAIVMRALSRNIGRRYQSAEELRRDLLAFARQRSLDVSAASLSSYMREAFPESFSAWDQMNSGELEAMAPVGCGEGFSSRAQGQAGNGRASSPAGVNVSTEESPKPPAAQILETVLQGEVRTEVDSAADLAPSIHDGPHVPSSDGLAASASLTGKSRFRHRYLTLGAAVAVAAVCLLVWITQRDGQVPAATSVGRALPLPSTLEKSSDTTGKGAEAAQAAPGSAEEPAVKQEPAVEETADRGEMQREAELRDSAESSREADQSESASRRDRSARKRSSRRRSKRGGDADDGPDERARSRRKSEAEASRRQDSEQFPSTRLLELQAEPKKDRKKTRKKRWDPDAPLPPQSSL